MSDETNDGVTRSDSQHTIKFNSVKEIHNAVLVYAGERPAALDEELHQIGQAHGGLGFAFAAMAMPRNGDSFAEKIVRDMGDLRSKHGYRGNWDYDGPGVFHKCTLKAGRNQDGTYFLTINAAYVGNQPEIDLAKSTGAPIGYQGCSLERTYASKGDRFAIPVKDIEAVYSALGQPFDQKAFVAALTTPQMSDWKPGKIDSHVSPVTVFDDGAVRSSLAFTKYRTVPAYQYQDEPKRDYEYRVENNSLTGPTRRDHRSSRPEAIGLALSIFPLSSPTYDTRLEQRIRDLGDAAEVAWKKALPAPSSKRPRTPSPL